MYSFTIILSIVIAIIFAFMSKPIANFYDNPKLIGVSLAMSIALLTTGMNMVPQAILAKQKRFLEINIAQVVSSLIAGTVAIFFGLHRI